MVRSRYKVELPTFKETEKILYAVCTTSIINIKPTAEKVKKIVDHFGIEDKCSKIKPNQYCTKSGGRSLKNLTKV